ncbi:uncharacterized protein LOC126898074 [Daktulosphaira vitifoliae]|uniref:uncharacterized protein LOC126898074 n=1 Tax=Daktulosphaira vitifoliae TaxID=58002 RepID=UPI0021A9FE89|nr:uncharacterized protein LOC126898074 [Daktulosphaira vitifoliae]
MGITSKFIKKRRDYMNIKRKNEEFRIKERNNEKVAKKRARLDYNKRKLENAVNLKNMRRRLKNNEIKEANRKAARLSMNRRLNDPAIKKANIEAAKVSMKKRLKNSAIKKANIEAAKVSMKKRLKNSAIKKANIEAAKVSMKKRLKNSAIKKANIEAAKVSMKKRLKNPAIKKANIEAAKVSMKKRLKNPVIKKANIEAAKISMKKKLEDPDTRKAYKKANSIRMLKRRASSNSSIGSSSRKRCYRVSSYRLHEKEKLNMKRQKWETLLSEYNLKKTQGLSETCVSCSRLRLPSSIIKTPKKLLRQLNMNIGQNDSESVLVCTSCYGHLKKLKIPPLYVGNGFQLNHVPQSVKELNQIERQMVSLRLPFMKVFKCLRGEGQLKIQGRRRSIENSRQRSKRTN